MWAAGMNRQVTSSANGMSAWKSTPSILSRAFWASAVVNSGSAGLCLGIALLVGVASFLLLQPRCIGQQDRAELLGAGRAPHLTPEALVDERREVSAVIDVCVASEQQRQSLPVRPGNGSQFRSRCDLSPWKSPQSIRTLKSPCSTRNRLPVTLPAPPRNLQDRRNCGSLHLNGSPRCSTRPAQGSSRHRPPQQGTHTSSTQHRSNDKHAPGPKVIGRPVCQGRRTLVVLSRARRSST